MKRVIPFVIVALAITAFWFRDRWLPPPPGQLNHLGYVEGETLLIGAPVAGRLVSLGPAKGAAVAAGTMLFRLDGLAAEAELARAEAAIVTAQAVHANLLTGKRPAERDVIRAQINEAEAGLDLARKEMKRAAQLAHTGTAAQSRLDAAETQVATFEARIVQLRATLDVAALPGRAEEIAAAVSRIAEARAGAEVARRKLADLSVAAPRAAQVEDIFFDAGEWVAAGQPVLSLLPADARTLRFFVPEASLAAASPGTKVTFHCDGCGQARSATITRVAATPEFTPPVIYSQGARAKLVFLVEARPDDSSRLQPGLPIEVEPLP